MASRKMWVSGNTLFVFHSELHININPGNAFEKWKFKSRKFYPCFGIDLREDGLGLRFELNLGGRTAHEFAFEEMRPAQNPALQAA